MLLRRIEVNDLYDAREAVCDLADPGDRIRPQGRVDRAIIDRADDGGELGGGDRQILDRARTLAQMSQKRGAHRHQPKG
jgi:hypothetical protein